MADDVTDDVLEVENGDQGSKKKRRRRRRRRKKSADAPKEQEPTTSRRMVGRRQMVEVSSSPAQTPASGRNPYRKRSSRAKRTAPRSVAARRRRLSRNEMASISDWLAEVPRPILGTIYRGLGGQPKRVSSHERLVQLTSKAIAQGNRVGGLVKQLHERDRKALGALLQAGGVAHHEEILHALSLSFGGHEREWRRSMNILADRGLVVAGPVQDDAFFYIVPDPLLDALVDALDDELSLPVFEHDDVRVIEHRPFAPPLDFSITSLATYIAQNGIRLTQRHDVYKHDQEALDAFFSQLWEPESELFQFHLDFLMMHGLVELRGDHLELNRDVTEEWLQLEPEDQRDLVFRALERRFEMAEWVMWAVHKAGGAWVAERPLVAMYRLWKRGRDWRRRFSSGAFGAHRTSERDSFTFSPLVQCGLLEMGQWGQEKFYRPTDRALALLEPREDDGFMKFYLTPDFKMMAPAGLAPILLYRMGEIAELTGCDRANTYMITEQSIEASLDAGWKRDDVLQFLRENSQIGLPDNIEQTLKGWIGHRGDVEFHDLMVITVHRSQIKRFEGHKRVKEYVLHRFCPGLYAVDRTRREEFERVLTDIGFSPAKETRKYPGAPEAVEARANLHKLLGEAREASQDPASRDGSIVEPGLLQGVPGTRVAAMDVEPDLPPKVDEADVRRIVDEALGKDAVLEMVYLARNGQRLPCEVQPQRLAFKGTSPVLVGLDVGEDERRTFVLDRIERLRIREHDGEDG